MSIVFVSGTEFEVRWWDGCSHCSTKYSVHFASNDALVGTLEITHKEEASCAYVGNGEHGANRVNYYDACGAAEAGDEAIANFVMQHKPA